MNLSPSSGILLHVTSLPGGRLGPRAYEFVDWLAAAGQTWWQVLRGYAAKRGVRLIGDIPIYVAAGGADVLAHPELFQQGVVAGAPPDVLSAVGQLWGNPLYDWGAMRSDA